MLMKRYKFLGLILLVLACIGQLSPVVGQQPLIRHFEEGEELIYEGEFSRSVLRSIDVADFKFSATKVPLSTDGEDQPSPTFSLQLVGEVKSKGFFSKLFNLNFLERVISIVEPKTFTVQSTKRFDQQGKRVRTSETTYDHKERKLVWVERDPREPTREPRVASASYTTQVQDVLSAIYFLRTQPMAIGQTLELSINDSGNVYQVPVRIVGKKRIKTVLGKVDTLVVDVQMFGAKKLIASDGEFLIWLTADERRIPVKAKVKTQYGTFDINLKRMIKTPSAQSARLVAN
jgi:hypothetical protein